MTFPWTLQQLGRVAKETRRAAKMTQAELATKSGVSRYTVIRFETGKLPDINYKTLVSILRALGLELRIGEQRVSGLPILGEGDG